MPGGALTVLGVSLVAQSQAPEGQRGVRALVLMVVELFL